MALKAVIDTTDGLPEAVAQEYTQREDGKFQLDVEAIDGLALEDVSSLKTALSKERTNAQTLAKQVKQYDGLDVKAAREALAKMDEIKNWDPDQKVNEMVKAREQQLIERHNQALTQREEEMKALSSQLEHNLITAAATAALAEHKGSVELLLPHVMRQTRMRKTDTGQYVAEVVDQEGNVRIGDAQGNPMTIPQLVGEMRSRETFARAFEGSGATGTGASPQANNRPNQNGTRTVKSSDQDAMNASLEDIAAGKVTVVD